MAIEKLSGGYLSTLTDAEIKDLYAEELKKDDNRFGGIEFTDSEKAVLLVDFLYGSKGIFALKGHKTAGKLGVPGVDKQWAEESGSKADENSAAEEAFLRSVLLERGIPEADHEAVIADIHTDIKKNHSGKKNNTYHTKEMKRLKVIRQAMGEVAFNDMAAD